VYLTDYEALWEMKVNIIGNVAMFIPIGIIWPFVYRKLDTHKKVIAAGVGFSLLIEILQLPFYDRVTDIDDLIFEAHPIFCRSAIRQPAGHLVFLFRKSG
jgi:glycopeptide antibiotics resistance protein